MKATDARALVAGHDPGVQASVTEAPTLPDAAREILRATGLRSTRVGRDRPIHNPGRYAVPVKVRVAGGNDLAFYKIEGLDSDPRLAGYRVAYGYRRGGLMLVPARQVRGVLERIADLGPELAAARYRKAIGTCRECGAPLTSATSRARGVGAWCQAHAPGAARDMRAARVRARREAAARREREVADARERVVEILGRLREGLFRVDLLGELGSGVTVYRLGQALAELGDAGVVEASDEMRPTTQGLRRQRRYRLVVTPPRLRVMEGGRA